MRPVSHIARQLLCLAFLLATGALSESVIAQQTFRFNFAASGGAVVNSIANQTCGTGVGGMGGGGMGGFCDGTPFSQQVINVGGQNYYHVIVGNGGGEFGIETYIQTGGTGVCWFGCANARVTGGMGGMGGTAPISSSSGLATNDSNPFAPVNAGAGNPTRAAIRQFNNTADMSQEFLKATTTLKPRITQSVTGGGLTMDFTIDMTNSNYSQQDTPGTITLTQTIDIEGLPEPGNNPITGDPFPSSRNFDINNLGETSRVDITGGRYTYAAGPGDGQSRGAYTYFADGFDVYNVDWATFCDPAQNPVSGCTNYGGVRGGMGGGGAGGGGGMGAALAIPAGTDGTTAGGGSTTASLTVGGAGATSGAQTSATLVTRTTTSTFLGGITTSTAIFTTTTSTTTSTARGSSGGAAGGGTVSRR